MNIVREYGNGSYANMEKIGKPHRAGGALRTVTVPVYEEIEEIDDKFIIAELSRKLKRIKIKCRLHNFREENKLANEILSVIDEYPEVNRLEESAIGIPG